MKALCIDIGNTRTKTGIFDNGQLLRVDSFHAEAGDLLKDFLSTHTFQHVIVAATRKHDLQQTDLNIAGSFIEMSGGVELPVKIVYSTPYTLGRDRIAAACGAHALYPNKHCLIVDAGTCMTMDLKLSGGVYLGGNISPGIRMRLKAMHEGTQMLPLAEPGFPDLPIGDSTLHAIQNGACLGAVMEIEGILNRARTAYGDVSIVITGGDAGFLAKELESQIFVEPELVMHGLFQILILNVQFTQ